MAKMIAVAEGFQSSVNIAYDLNDDDKLRSYIPTQSALDLLENILLSTKAGSTDRARIIIGAYGIGKSHIVLMILSTLMHRDLSLFERMMPVIREQRPKLYQLIQDHYAHSKKLLPVVITGSSNSIVQAFMLALQRTMEENGLQDVLPETNYQAAIEKIHDWKEHYGEVYEKFSQKVGDVQAFEERLSDFDPSAYDKFEAEYPDLTAGSAFNPFVGFDVVDLYAGVVKQLHSHGYGGIYVIYDEFSKYLENHISEATKSDTKTLQDFAEYCGRSGDDQLHIMLISHKEITSYIGNASKKTIDGWRGVSERFHHIYLNNNFTQTYEIIASAIRKDPDKWDSFIKKNRAEFRALETQYSEHPIFSDLYKDGVASVIYGCYPLHPVSTFILPRLSERVAQNERTLFTFISASGSATLSSFLRIHSEDDFCLATPDLIYDYFEPLLRQEIYAGNLHKYYVLAASILRNIPEDGLAAKIIKTLALIYILEQFEKLCPTVDELVKIYASSMSAEAVRQTIDDLIENQYVIYLKRSNGYLKLKETSGVNVPEAIRQMVGKRQAQVDVRRVLNDSNFDNYLYPSRYNDDKEMTRYFKFEFIDSAEVDDNINWSVKSENIKADGVVFAVIAKDGDDIDALKRSVIKSSDGCKDCIIAIPDRIQDISGSVREYDAVKLLMDMASDDRVLFDDYEVVYDDLQELIRKYIAGYTHPENRECVYISNGDIKTIRRKSELSGLCSDICEALYSRTPRINNEVINKEDITSIARSSREKIISGLLRERLEHGLGLKGNGQEVSIMRSTLIRTNVLEDDGETVSINMDPKGNEDLAHVLHEIMDFISMTKGEDPLSFSVLYERLIMPEYHIGMRRGLIPIYVAAVLHEFRKQIVIRDKNGQVPLNSDTVEQINADPRLFNAYFIDWDKDKEDYVKALSDIFHADSEEYDDVAAAIRSWYMGLPKYSKMMRTYPDGEKISGTDAAFLAAIRKDLGSYDLLFEKIPKAYGSGNVNAELAEKVKDSKVLFDSAIGNLKEHLISWMRTQFCTKDTASCRKMSLTSIIKDWCEKIEPTAFEQLFEDGTGKCLSIFKAISNDEQGFVTELGRMATDLRLEDWDAEVIGMFCRNMLQYRSTAENFHVVEIGESKDISAQSYQLTFTGKDGNTVTKRFSQVETTTRGKLLYNSIVNDIDGMGQSISEAEKRQILMNVLKELC